MSAISLSASRKSQSGFIDNLDIISDSPLARKLPANASLEMEVVRPSKTNLAKKLSSNVKFEDEVSDGDPKMKSPMGENSNRERSDHSSVVEYEYQQPELQGMDPDLSPSLDATKNP